jgi:hypothetical protein
MLCPNMTWALLRSYPMHFVFIRNWEFSAPWTKVSVKVPTKFIVGDMDVTYNTPGVKDYIQKGWSQGK